jgi:hypothetical protein
MTGTFYTCKACGGALYDMDWVVEAEQLGFQPVGSGEVATPGGRLILYHPIHWPGPTARLHERRRGQLKDVLASR